MTLTIEVKDREVLAMLRTVFFVSDEEFKALKKDALFKALVGDDIRTCWRLMNEDSPEDGVYERFCNLLDQHNIQPGE